MAKTATKSRKSNKSRAILKYHTSHKKAKPRDIATALTKSGVKVTPQYVSTILFNYRKKMQESGETVAATRTARAKSKNGRRAKSTASQNGVSANEIMLAKQLVNQTGSVGAARKALDLYNDIIA